MENTESEARRQRRITRLKQLNYSISVDDEKVEATVKTLGLTYSDYDGISAQPKPYQLMKLLESARFYAHHWPLDETGRTFRDYAKMTSNRMTFMVTSRMDICENLYVPTISKSPIDVKITSGHIGNTSTSTIATAFSKDGTKLLSNVNQVVSMDKETRRPSQLPDWWKSKYARSAENHEPLKVNRLEKADNLEPFQIRVLRSDLDGYRHVNWSSYVRFSLDAIYHSVKNKKLSDLEDIDTRGLKSMELLYSGECFDDDVLDIFVWEPTGSANEAAVQIFKGSNLIFQGCFEYFSTQFEQK